MRTVAPTRAAEGLRVAMGIGAMCTVMLRLPLTSVLLATLLLASVRLAVMPLVIVAVVFAQVASAHLERFTQPKSDSAHPRTSPA